jgi:hypothetical protein
MRADGPALAYLRRDGADAFAVVVNSADQPLEWELSTPSGTVAAEPVRLAGGEARDRRAVAEGDTLRVSVPARKGVVVRLRLR